MLADQIALMLDGPTPAGRQPGVVLRAAGIRRTSLGSSGPATSCRASVVDGRFESAFGDLRARACPTPERQRLDDPSGSHCVRARPNSFSGARPERSMYLGTTASCVGRGSECRRVEFTARRRATAFPRAPTSRFGFRRSTFGSFPVRRHERKAATRHLDPAADVANHRRHEPDLDRDTALALYRSMSRIRQFEDRVHGDVIADKFEGYVHCYAGEEAVGVGVIAQLRSDDWLTSTYRNHGHAIARGVPLEAIAGELMGRASGVTAARAVRCTWPTRTSG